MLPNQLFQEQPLNREEEDLLHAIFSNPTVLRYFRVLAQNEVSDFLMADFTEDPEEAYARQHAHLKGKLAILATLTSISQSTEGA